MPKVSIIIPVYKTEAFIEKCARSLFEQTFKDIEYIFVNDATPDNSIDILEKVISEYPERKSYQYSNWKRCLLCRPGCSD